MARSDGTKIWVNLTTTATQQDPSTAHIPVIALSANAMPRNIKIALEAGFFAYLTKPIKINEFPHTLNKALKSSQMTSGSIANEKPA